MDTIYREQAIATIDELNAVSFYEANEHSREAYKDIRIAIEQLPSADKTGKWIDVENDIDYYPFMCSECYETVIKKTNYCPNCGARMEE